MLISCEKCSTTYVLDDALIPPQGTPVQCTRCSHIFTARLVAAPLPAATAAPPAWENPDLRGRPANSTLVFGAKSAPVPAASGPANQTLVFGGGGAHAPPPAAARAQNINQTMAFGTPAATQPPAKPAAPAASSAHPKQTMVFGVGAPAPAPKANQTMVFGAGAAPTAPAKPQPAAPPQKPAFGTPTARAVAATGADDERTVAGGDVPKNQTVMFGRAAPAPRAGVVRPPEPREEPPESTVRVKVEPGPGDTADEDASENPAQDAGADVLTAPARHDRTQLFAMEEKKEAPDRHNRTVLFAMNPREEPAKVDARTRKVTEKVPAADLVATLPADNDVPPGAINQTLMFGGGAPAEDPVASLLLEAGDAAGSSDSDESSLGSTLSDVSPNQNPHMAPLRVELPPEPQFMATPVPQSEDEVADEVAAAAVRAASNRRTTIAVVIFLVIALVLGLVLAFYVLGARFGSKESSQIIQKTQDAMTVLRRDDDEGQAAAVAQLEALVAAHPKALEPLAALVIARACVADDTNADSARRKQSLDEQRGSETAGDRGKAAEARSLAQRRREELVATVEALEALVAQSQESDPREVSLVVRARAFSAAVLGSPNAVALAEEFRQKSGGADSWADLALPEYAVNGGSSFDDALSQLQELEHRDTTFLRAYALTARLQLLKKDPEAADATINNLLTMSPSHDTAKALQQWLASRKRND